MPPPSAATQRLLQVYGRIGTRLLRKSDAQDAHACMRLAVIALLKGWPDEACRWLRQARDAGHSEALGLLNHPHRRLAAAELAYRYGCHYKLDANQLSVAMFFSGWPATTAMRRPPTSWRWLTRARERTGRPRAG